MTIEIEIQTDTLEEEPQVEESAQAGTETPTQEGEESLASSSSTILPPTPKAHTRSLSLSAEDEPPTYNQVAAQRLEEEKTRRVVSDALSRWHLGAKLRSLYASAHAHAHDHTHAKGGSDVDVVDDRADTLDGINAEPIEGGVTEDLVEEWKALKEELGVECLVIDKILENSTKIPRTPASPSASTTSADKGKRRSGRFFNIYNTYVYGSSDSTPPATSATTTTPPKSFATTLTNLATQTLLFASASAVVFVALTPYIPYLLSSSTPTVPGGASMYDRAAWASFNTLGGGAGEGIAFAARTGAGVAGFGAGLFGLGGWGMGAGGAAGGAGIGMGGVGGTGARGDAQTTEAVWRVLERVGGGAARIARGLT